MGRYRYHVFFCTNQREDGRSSCNDCGAREAREYVKQRCKALGIHGTAQVRINTAGCLDRCEQGPVIVIYPDETWYTYVDHADLDEIIEEHLCHGRRVERLSIDRTDRI